MVFETHVGSLRVKGLIVLKMVDTSRHYFVLVFGIISPLLSADTIYYNILYSQLWFFFCYGNFCLLNVHSPILQITF